MNADQQYEMDVRLYGVQAALDMAALRQKIEIHRQLSELEAAELAKINELRESIGEVPIVQAKNVKDPFNETRERIERLFKCAHPIFGSIAANGAPTAKEAFEVGIKIGEEAA